MGRPLDIKWSGKFYTGNLKWLGGRYPIGRQRSLKFLPERVLRHFTWEAPVQDLDCLPSPQYPKFLSQFRQHDANSQVMKPDVRLHNQKSRKMVGPMEENGVYPFSGQISKLKSTTTSQVSCVQKGIKTGQRRVAWEVFPARSDCSSSPKESRCTFTIQYARASLSSVTSNSPAVCRLRLACRTNE